MNLRGADINALSDREAMGLPASYVPGSCDDRGHEVERLRSWSRDALAHAVEDPTASLVRRHVAGTLLALLGDPRIEADAPAMIDIPGGRVSVGLDPGRVDEITNRYAAVGVRREWIVKECPRFTVELAAFRIARYPVTNFEYRRYLQESRDRELPTSWPFGVYPNDRANHPVYTVTAEAAERYAAWLGRRLSRRFRLPTEIEWEAAAAGATGREFPWGAELELDRANTLEAGIAASTPVGMFPLGASPYGVLDLAGNVEELVADEYRPYPGGTVVADDLQLHAPSYRVARGGSFARFADLARCSRRHGRFERALYVMGFRLAEDAM